VWVAHGAWCETVALGNLAQQWSNRLIVAQIGEGALDLVDHDMVSALADTWREAVKYVLADHRAMVERRRGN
jgi:hypothetical protein